MLKVKIKRMWNRKTAGIPVVIGTSGSVLLHILLTKIQIKVIDTDEHWGGA